MHHLDRNRQRMSGKSSCHSNQLGERRVTDFGEVVLPKSIRKATGLRTYSQVEAGSKVAELCFAFELRTSPQNRRLMA